MSGPNATGNGKHHGALWTDDEMQHKEKKRQNVTFQVTEGGY